MAEQGVVRVQVTVEYGDLTVSSSVQRTSGNPAFAPRLTRAAGDVAVEEAARMLAAVTGDIDARAAAS